MRYRFFPTADRRQDDIWDYTYDTWGEEQADAYIEGLHVAIDSAAKGEKRWRKLEHTKLKEVYFIKYRHHFIFFKVLSNGTLGIISILHENMDVPSRILEDVQQ